ncbi:hypothetical protein KCP73_00915 [Salmonella enterica subsp. enterica]|nr:hypothetical protein KCP73_00915 [Salmonella enterica subsp. enterica]
MRTARHSRRAENRRNRSRRTARQIRAHDAAHRARATTPSLLQTAANGSELRQRDLRCYNRRAPPLPSLVDVRFTENRQSTRVRIYKASGIAFEQHIIPSKIVSGF